MDTITQIHKPTARTTVRGTRVPAYFLGRRREVWVSAMSAPPALAHAA